MATLTDADIKRPSQREYATALEDEDVFVMEDVSAQKIKPITKTNVKATLGITDAEGTLAYHETRLDSTELTLARTNQDLASVKQTLQQGNGATLDFSDIGIVPLDARATGRANPTVEGRTATNLVVNGKMNVDSDGNGVADGWTKDASLICTVSSDGQKLTVDDTIGKGDRGVYQTNLLARAGDIVQVFFSYRYINTLNTSARVRLWFYDSSDVLLSNIITELLAESSTFINGSLRVACPVNTAYIKVTPYIRVMEDFDSIGEITYTDVLVLNLTSIYGSGNEPTASDCAKIFGYFDGTKSIQLPARVRSVGRNLCSDDNFKTGKWYKADGTFSTHVDSAYSEEYFRIPENSILVLGIDGVKGTSWNDMIFYDTSKNYISGYHQYNNNVFTSPSGAKYCRVSLFFESGFGDLTKVQINIDSLQSYEPYQDSTLYIADNEEVRSVQAVSDTVSVVNGEHMLTKKISTPVSVASGVAVNVTNYPTAKTGGKFAVELTAGGTQIGVIGTDSTSGAGTLRFELATPLTTPLLTSGILQAKPNGTVYYEPYYEGSHQTDASSQITLPYEGTIDKLTGYDENLEPYEVPSTAYTLVGTLLTITGAVENEVFYVELSRSEPLAPEMGVNVLNNDQVTLDSADGKYYQIGFTTTNGVPTVTATEVL